jgi:hypothetical protein
MYAWCAEEAEYPIVFTFCTHSSAEEQLSYKQQVGGSIPSECTRVKWSFEFDPSQKTSELTECRSEEQ